MKKISKILTIIFVLIGLVIAGFSIPILYNYFQRTLPKETSHVNVYVNSTIYSSLSTEINQYKEDIIAQGYTVDIVNWSLNDVTTLKNHILNASQQDKGLFGAVLIGKLPYATARHMGIYGYEFYPSDLYLMDLDGTWTDTIVPNGMFDVDNNEHINGTGDLYPEIWVSRISPYSLTGVNYITELKNYFNRNHNYRNGDITRPHKALLYIDDEWSTWTSEWVSNFTAYPGNQTICYSNNALTNSTNFLGNLSVNYEYVHIMAHSNGTDQLFGVTNNPYQPNPVDGILNYYDINHTDTMPLFYNLYSCYTGNFTRPNNLGTHYLFNPYALNVIACSRSGGMSLYQTYYDALKDGKVLGEGYRLWFYNPEIILYSHWPEMYGMVMLGDPLLTI